MANLKTNYMGLQLKNPIIVGASNLVNNQDNLKRMEDAGAAAIVYKSLFEEQIQLERLELDEERDEYQERNAEMITLFPDIEHAGPSEHLMKLRLAKESVVIPVIASLNCVWTESWVEYAKQIEQTGVDGLELNFYHVPREAKGDGKDILEQQVEILKAVKKAVKIPVNIKLSPFYTNAVNAIEQLDKAGAGAFVLFNRVLQPDINIDSEQHVNHFSPSSHEEGLLPLRFAGLLYGNVKGSICANTGVYSGGDVVKMVLAGADVVQVVSTLYKNKISHLAVMLNEITLWMDSKGYKTIGDFKGKLSQKTLHDPYIYKRAQYIDILSKSSEIFKKYPLH
jgi:dihydroorotate dehydrogenase (fumarate)